MGQITPEHYALRKELVTYLKKKGYTVIEEQIYNKVMPTTRKWRADYFIPELNLMIEINGGKWTKSIHTYGDKLDDNLNKHNTASINGFILLQFTYDMLKAMDYKNFIK